MVFVSVCRAIYDYAPTGVNELEIKEDDLLFILDKNTGDDWWKAKKKAAGDDEDEPEGLIPNNYVEEAKPVAHAKALYDYSRQTDEELSFSEDDVLEVYDTSDPDWSLVGLANEFGFAPANYIEIKDHSAAGTAPPAPVSAPSPEAASPALAAAGPAAALAGLIQQRTGPQQSRQVHEAEPEASDEEPAPSLPRRPPSQITSPPPMPTMSPREDSAPGIMESPAVDQHSRGHDLEPPSPSGFRLYNIHEMVSHMGRNKKMPMTLGINSQRGTITIAPERARDGPQQEWTAERLTHYSIEGKHVFMELVRPSKSIDFHAGAKDTAAEIVAALGDLAGAARAGQQGLGEVIAAGTGGPTLKRGKMLYEFMAQGDDEVTVAVDDEVIVLDDLQSEEWWMVRRLKNGKEGVVPSSYVEITGFVPTSQPVVSIEPPVPSSTSTSTAAPAPVSGTSATTRSLVEQNRRDEEALTKKAVRFGSEGGAEVGAGFPTPNRKSSLAMTGDNTQSSSQTERRSSRRARSVSEPKSKPNAARVRTWVDRTANFKVEAEFLTLKDGKIHLHKLNGVKIAVPVSKMSVEDLEYVEQQTGQSLDEDKPLSDIKRRSTLRVSEAQARALSTAGATVEAPQPKYDWFDFFLACGVNPQICERYTAAFVKDEMGEENLPDIDARLLRTLGLKEGDILRVMKHLDTKFGRSRNAADGSAGGEGAGLFSGAGGALRNNTRKGRPAPAVQSNDTVSAEGLGQSVAKDEPSAPTPVVTTAPPTQTAANGFDDNAWDNRPSKSASPAPPAQPRRPTSTPATAPAAAPRPAVTGAMSELSLLDEPLQPAKALQPQPAAQISSQPQPVQPQATGATSDFFNQLAQPAAQTPQQLANKRTRPTAPQQTASPGALLPPPPSRPLSAPQNQQASQFAPPPLVAQNTGYQVRLAPPGQSLNEVSQQRIQQQMQPTGPGYGYGPQQQPMQGFNQFQAMQPQPTGYPQQQAPYGQYPQQPLPYQPTGMQGQFGNGQMGGSPFADPPRLPYQPTGNFGQPNFMQQQPPPQQVQPQPTGINSFLPAPLQPQPTGINGFGNQQTNGFGGYGQQQNAIPPPPPIPQQQNNLQPLQPQKTGPAPPVRFGVSAEATKLTPQPTGRANLSKATPQNPFGF